VPILTHEERVGTLLGGKYRLGKILGRGGMGAVFESVHEWTGRAVAVKVLSHEHVENPEAAERFLREARVVAGLKHPNVVDVLDLGEEPDRTVFMVLELLEGESFGRMLYREKTLSFERAAEVLVPVMRAVAYAHGRNVVHRDIKPENIFLHTDAEGNRIPKILDFGIAKALDEERDQHVTQTGFVMGTPAYMSPEQGEGIPSRIGAPADVWSMGVVWYEALSGALPFEGPTPTSILLAVNSGKFTRLVKRLPSLPVSLANAIDKAIVRDVARRYPDMGAFLDAITKAAAEAGEATPARGSTPGATRSSRERISPTPQDPEVRLSAPDASNELAIELGPVRAMPPVAEITMGDTTDEPVVLLNNPRRKRRKRPVVAIGLTLAALAAAGVVALLIARAPSTPTNGRDTPTATAALQAQLPAQESDASASTPPAVEAPAAPRDDAPDAAVEAPSAPTPSRHGHHGSHGSHAQPEAPAPLILPQPAAPPVAPPTPAATPTEAPARAPETPPPTADTHGHHSRGDHPPLPRENAPITDYDPAQ
jgi:eukaryotic-like serine/threonine-protein kinase